MARASGESPRNPRSNKLKLVSVKPLMRVRATGKVKGNCQTLGYFSSSGTGPLIYGRAEGLLFGCGPAGLNTGSLGLRLWKIHTALHFPCEIQYQLIQC